MDARRDLRLGATQHRTATLVATAYVASRELRNDTAGVLRRVQHGEEVIITVRGEPVAEIIPIREGRRRWIPREELLGLLSHARADLALRDDLERIAGDTTDDLGPIW